MGVHYGEYYMYGFTKDEDRVVVTKENKNDYVHECCGRYFIPQQDFKTRLPLVINEYLVAEGKLFLDSIDVLTETLSSLAMESIEKFCKHLGYIAVCKNESHQGKYLYSDGGGHYSTDYYESIEYAVVTITA